MTVNQQVQTFWLVNPLNPKKQSLLVTPHQRSYSQNLQICNKECNHSELGEKQSSTVTMCMSAGQAQRSAECSGAQVGLGRSFAHYHEHIRPFTPTWNNTFDWKCVH